jgi:hypothetical protein
MASQSIEVTLTRPVAKNSSYLLSASSGLSPGSTPALRSRSRKWCEEAAGNTEAMCIV